LRTNVLSSTCAGSPKFISRTPSLKKTHAVASHKEVVPIVQIVYQDAKQADEEDIASSALSEERRVFP